MAARGSVNVIWLGEDRRRVAAARQALASAVGGRLRVHHAATVPMVLDRLRGGEADAVVLDAGLRRMPALDAFRVIQSEFPLVPVVVVAAYQHEEGALHIVEAGAQDWFSADRIGDGEFVARVLDAAVQIHRLGVDLANAGRREPDENAVLRQRRELDRLQELNRSRTQLLNTAAHELSTPMTPIKLQVSLLQSPHLGPLTPGQKEALDILERNVDRLMHLIQDVLDVARIEGHRLKLRRAPVSMARLAQETVESFGPQARAAGVTLVLEAGDGPEIEADARRLSQVLYNLTHNALKFTPRGGTVRVRATAEEGAAVVHVQDSGVGLRADDFGRLFQPFSQVHDTMQITRSGAGLGLFISQGIVEQHGGRIWCDSAGPDKGSTFSFMVPLAAQEGVAVMASSPTARAAAETPASRGVWPFISFKCPACQSRDIQMRVLKNRYECNACANAWR